MTASSGSAVFAGNLTAQGGALYLVDANTYLTRQSGYAALATDQASLSLTNATKSVALGATSWRPTSTGAVNLGHADLS